MDIKKIVQSFIFLFVLTVSNANAKRISINFEKVKETSKDYFVGYVVSEEEPSKFKVLILQDSAVINAGSVIFVKGHSKGRKPNDNPVLNKSYLFFTKKISQNIYENDLCIEISDFILNSEDMKEKKVSCFPNCKANSVHEVIMKK